MFVSHSLTGLPTTKNPRLTGNRGFFENLTFRLELSSREARAVTTAMLPLGHLSFGPLSALIHCNRCSHFARALLNRTASFVNSSSHFVFGVHPLGCSPAQDTLKGGHQTPWVYEQILLTFCQKGLQRKSLPG